jgi:hypothetical protein
MYDATKFIEGDIEHKQTLLGEQATPLSNELYLTLAVPVVAPASMKQPDGDEESETDPPKSNPFELAAISQSDALETKLGQYPDVAIPLSPSASQSL